MQQDVLSSPAMTRLVDYFVEVVAEPSDAFLQQENENFERKVVIRIPPTDHRDFALPDGVPFFCIPERVAFYNPSVYERKPTFFSFILTRGDGTHAYGFALHFFDKYTDSDWRPRVLCLISHHAFFSLFKEIVSWMYRSRYLTAERSVVQTKIAHACEDHSWFLSPRHAAPPLSHPQPQRPTFINQVGQGFRASVPCWESNATVDAIDGVQEEHYQILEQLLAKATRPAAGSALEIRLRGQDFFRYHVQRGKAVHLDDYCFQMLFQCLSLKNVVYIINCLLLEQRVLIHSNHHGLLTPVCEALCALLFPFAWEHVFIPFLPVKLIEYLQAPVPYFIGLHTSSLATRVGSEIFSSCVVVHLDKDKVVSPIFSRIDGHPMDFALPRLPSKEVKALLTSLEGVVPTPIGSGAPLHSTAHLRPESAAQRESTTASEVELTFGDGPLGLTLESTHLRLLAASNFEPGRQLGGSAVVKALPRLRNGLAGPAERSGLISRGSFLIGINGEPTLDLTFEETIDYLRRGKRPIRLRFLNASQPYENACQFAERLQALSLVSALQTEHQNKLLPWVDALRGSFAVMFASIFRDYQRHIGVERNKSAVGPQRALPKPEHYGRARRRSSALAFSVKFDHKAFSDASPSADTQSFLREFTQTQSFAGFVNESVMGRFVSRPQGECSPLDLFKECVHLVRESSSARAAIALLFERNLSVVSSTVLDLSVSPAEAEDRGRTTSTSPEEPQVCSSPSSKERSGECCSKPVPMSPATELIPRKSPMSTSPSTVDEEEANADAFETSMKQREPESSTTDDDSAEEPQISLDADA